VFVCLLGELAACVHFAGRIFEHGWVHGVCRVHILLESILSVESAATLRVVLSAAALSFFASACGPSMAASNIFVLESELLFLFLPVEIAGSFHTGQKFSGNLVVVGSAVSFRVLGHYLVLVRHKLEGPIEDSTAAEHRTDGD